MSLDIISSIRVSEEKKTPTKAEPTQSESSPHQPLSFAVTAGKNWIRAKMKDGSGAELLVLRDLVQGEPRGIQSDAQTGILRIPAGDQ